MNVVCLVGRLTANPELRQTPTGTNVCTFSIAVQSNQKKADGTYKTNFINCVAWRQSAEFITRYFRKGQNIGIQGSIDTRQYQDKETGKSRTVFEVVVNNTFFVESKGTNTSEAPATPTPPESNSPDLDDFSEQINEDGDLPF